MGRMYPKPGETWTNEQWGEVVVPNRNSQVIRVDKLTHEDIVALATWTSYYVDACLALEMPKGTPYPQVINGIRSLCAFVRESAPHLLEANKKKKFILDGGEG